MNEEAGYKATWDTRITYLLCGKSGQHYRIIIYMLNGNKVRFMMGHTESIVDVVQSHARQAWEELIQDWLFSQGCRESQTFGTFFACLIEKQFGLCS